MRLVILIALALVVSTVQCVSACAQDDCSAKSQPCHQHDSSPQASCTHQIPVAKSPTLISTAALPIQAAPVNFTALRREESRPALQVSITPPPLLALRI